LAPGGEQGGELLGRVMCCRVRSQPPCGSASLPMHGRPPPTTVLLIPLPPMCRTTWPTARTAPTRTATCSTPRTTGCLCPTSETTPSTSTPTPTAACATSATWCCRPARAPATLCSTPPCPSRTAAASCSAACRCVVVVCWVWLGGLQAAAGHSSTPGCGGSRLTTTTTPHHRAAPR
jgi:hypothetical protein